MPRKAEGFQSDIFPPANSSEPAMTATEWFGGKTARPNVVDLETRAVSVSKAPLATPAPSTPKPSSPKPETKEEPKPEAKKEEPKPEPKEEPKEEPKAPTPKSASPSPSPEPEVKSKDLEIEQPDSSDDEKSAPKAALGVATAVAGGAALGASALAAKLPAHSTPASGAATPANGAAPVNTSDDLLVKLISDKATLPTRGSALSAGHDLYAAADTVVPARGKALVDTGLSIAVPAGTYGRIAPRSGLAAKHSIDTGAGVIDADYRGEVKVLLFNYGDADFEVKHGDRVAQLILERVHMAPVRQVDDLEATVRGAGGFGSTGGFGR